MTTKTKAPTVEQIAEIDPVAVEAERAKIAATERADAALSDSDYKSGTVHGHAVWDHDAQQIAHFFNSGDAKQQKEDAAQHMGRLLGKTGDAEERDLSLVKIVEA